MIKKKFILLVVLTQILLMIIVYFVFVHGNKITNITNNYNIGKEINFIIGGNSEKYVIKGFSAPEKNFTWTDAKESIIHMYVNGGQNTTLKLNVDGFGIFNKKIIDYQQVTVFANNQQIAVWKVTENNTYAAIIPASVMKTNELTLLFKIAKPYSPVGDSRKLGMAVQKIVITKKFASHLKKKVSKWLQKHILVGDKPEDF